jgi:polyhydroxyalkanoate synthesis regulator protein
MTIDIKTATTTTKKTTTGKTARAIRKYRNRKLYDLNEHTYVTLQQIYGYYNEGVEVKVTGPEEQDITQEVLFQSIIYTRMKDQQFLDMVLENGRKN